MDVATYHHKFDQKIKNQSPNM